MATTTTARRTAPTKRARKPSSSAATRRRAPKKANTPVTRKRATTRSAAAVTGRALGKPLKEALFVGIGFVDWMAEQFWTIEKEFASRGERRSKTLRTLAVRASSSASHRTAALYSNARVGLSSVTDAMGDGVRRIGNRIPTMQPAA